VDGGTADDVDTARRLAADIGMPLLVKAAGGGGGRGMHLVHDVSDLETALERATAEAAAAFGDPRVYLERFVAAGRHVEVQILGDGRRVVQLGERDCSVQRRYQKLVEESPAPVLDPTLRDRVRAAAVRLGEHLGYRGAGTVEFLVDQDRGSFHFLEVNARLQVEHPVTEAVTGIDLVAAQLAIAEGGRLPFTQDEIDLDGHAIECRINAEDPDHGFAPSPGSIDDVWFPVGPGIRVDAGVQTGSEVVPYYDSLVAKLIVQGADRDEALRRLVAALGRVELRGIATTVPLLAEVVTAEAFEAGGVTTTWLERFLERRARGVAVAAEVR
jgi:acetyl-CoA carboxylase, biotin carboxylase subunit